MASRPACVFESLLVLLADTILPFFRTPILPWFGEPIHPILSIFVAEYYCIFVFGVPFFMLFFIRWEFLTAHEITKPLGGYLCAVLPCGVVLSASMCWLVAWIGFPGAPVALNAVTASHALLLVVYLAMFKPHHPDSWQGLSAVWQEALAWDKVTLYLKLGTSGILSVSEWWFWEVLVLIVGTFGVVPLNVLTIAIQTVLVINMIPRSVGSQRLFA